MSRSGKADWLSLWYSAPVVTGIVWQNSEIETLRPKGPYRHEDVVRIEGELEKRGTLAMRPLPSGLFPAAITTASRSGYGNVWVRDNVYVAYAHHLRGMSDVAAHTVRAIFEFFWRHRQRFDAIISGDVDPNDVAKRPHIRFDGTSLTELPQEHWPHAQNDALGYALWLCSKLAAAGAIELDRPVTEMLALFPRYFAAIRYWEDEDSGHWEETRKREASSIGTVVAGLEALIALADGPSDALRATGFDLRLINMASDLVRAGRVALDAILPSECIQISPQQNRRYDAALLFLIYPLEVVAAQRTDQILSDTDRFLIGRNGVRRYLGDSYWAPDYDEHLAEEDRTRDFSNDMASRDELLERIGDEAQWCIFDPIISAHYGRCYLESRSTADLDRQIHHFERTLAQITPAWRCPELYYLKHRVYVPNPHTPLLWTQSNLWMALVALHASMAAA
jgi:hypothetical protein